MTAVILDGAGKDDRFAAAVREAVISAISRVGAEIKYYALGDCRIAPCEGRFSCWLTTPGVCVFKDAGSGIQADAEHADYLFFISPVVYGGYSFELKNAVERLFPGSLPVLATVNGLTCHAPRRKKYPILAVIGIIDSPCEKSEALFKTLAASHVGNMHVPAVYPEIFYRKRSGAGEILSRIKSLMERLKAEG